MATQKVKPDPSILERQDRRPQRRQTYRKVGTYALVTAVVVVVAAAAFALWSSERTPDEVPLGRPSATGPTVTGPTEPSATGPAVTGRTTGTTASPSEVVEGPNGFWHDGSEPAAPEHGKHGKLIMSDTSGPGAYPSYAVYVFADGRVIWRRRTGAVNTTTKGWLERRLTPKGIDLLRPGATAVIGDFGDPEHLDPLGLPAGAWADPTSEPSRPSRYAVCPRGPSAATVWRLLPARARALLRGSEAGHIHRCLVVTTGDARVLDQILVKDGFERTNLWRGLRKYGIEAGAATVRVGVFPVLPNATFDVWRPLGR